MANQTSRVIGALPLITNQHNEASANRSVDTALERVRQEQAAVPSRIAIEPLTQRGGVAEYPVDLAQLISATQMRIEGRYYGVFFSQVGSDVGALLDLDFSGGGRLRRFGVGGEFKGPFDGMTVRPSSLNAVNAGIARLVLLSQPDASYDEETIPGTYNRITYAQTYNSAAGNRPTLATQGISLAGVRGVRAAVFGDNIGAHVANLLTGTIAGWYYDPDNNIWVRGVSVSGDLSDNSGLLAYVTADYQVFVPHGRFYLEVVSATTDAGSGNLQVDLQTFG